MPLQPVAAHDECTFNANDRTYIIAGIILDRMLRDAMALEFLRGMCCAVNVSSY
jgi:hypothetical protein